MMGPPRACTMTPSRTHDRDAILARRALFISTALAGLACTGSKSAAEGEPPAAVSEAGEPAPPEPPAVPEPDASWAEVMAAAPPLNIPEGVGERERNLLQTLVMVQEGKLAKLEAMWSAQPECGADAKDCEAWAKLVEQLDPFIEDDSDRGVFGGCDVAVGETGTVRARWAAHGRFQAAVVSRLEAHLERVARHYGEPSAQAWRGQVMGARAPKPMPCLSPCARSAFTDELAQLPFAKDSAALAFDEPELQIQLQLDGLMQRHRGSFAAEAVLVVRGHADPSEAEPEALAKQRAEAVVAWLVEAGVDAARLEAVGMGARYPIEQGAAGLEHNPRVDFELIPPGLARARGRAQEPGDGAAVDGGYKHIGNG